MNRNGPKQEQVVHTKQTSITSINIVPERLVQRVWRTKLPSQSFPVLAHTYSLPLMYDCTKPIRYVTLHFRDQRDAASLRQGIAPKSLFLCVNTQKPFPVCALWFCWYEKRRSTIACKASPLVRSTGGQSSPDVKRIPLFIRYDQLDQSNTIECRAVLGGWLRKL